MLKHDINIYVMFRFQGFFFYALHHDQLPHLYYLLWILKLITVLFIKDKDTLIKMKCVFKLSLMILILYIRETIE